MCTAMKIGECFGRTLDLEYGYAEQVVLTPRNFPLPMRHRPALATHYAMLGMATVVDGFPLYYDAVNERGLAMAGLNFPHSGRYAPARQGDVTSFELILFVLGQCKSVVEAKELLAQTRVCDTSFSTDYPATRLHWMVADATESIVVESTAAGLTVYNNPIGVMTNEPTFDRQLAYWERFAPLTPNEPSPTPPHLGRGSGSLGLPGDFTSPSRLVRAAFAVANSRTENNPIGQFFHAMAMVEVPRGCVCLPDGQQVTSRYTSCMDMREKVYYYHTYGCHRIHGVRLTEPAGDALRTFPLPQGEDVRWQA